VTRLFVSSRLSSLLIPKFIIVDSSVCVMTAETGSHFGKLDEKFLSSSLFIVSCLFHLTINSSWEKSCLSFREKTYKRLSRHPFHWVARLNWSSISRLVYQRDDWILKFSLLNLFKWSLQTNSRHARCHY
jgi:hypothetical protein